MRFGVKEHGRARMEQIGMEGQARPIDPRSIYFIGEWTAADYVETPAQLASGPDTAFSPSNSRAM